MKINKQTEEFKKSCFNIARILFLGAALALSGLMITGCAKYSPLVTVDMPTATASPSETPVPVPTLTLTPTKDPFEGLKACRTWREAVNCPITENDFVRISDYVKANFTFPPEAFRVKNIRLGNSYESLIYIEISTEDVKANFSKIKNYHGYNPFQQFEDSLRPTGKAFFFNLKANPPVTNWDYLIAVFPVNNSDGSLGTYTIFDPVYVPYIRSQSKSESDKGTKEWIEKTMDTVFEIWPYCPPHYILSGQPEKNRKNGWGGTLEQEIFQDTMNPNGKRKVLIDEWVRTGIIPNELEKIPMFACSGF